jgi:hypothetical protein
VQFYITNPIFEHTYFSPEYGGVTFLRNVGTCPQNQTVWQPKKQFSLFLCSKNSCDSRNYKHMATADCFLWNHYESTANNTSPRSTDALQNTLCAACSASHYPSDTVTCAPEFTAPYSRVSAARRTYCSEYTKLRGFVMCNILPQLVTCNNVSVRVH